MMLEALGWRIDRTPAWAVALVAGLTGAVVAAADIVTGPEISTSLFYVLPLALLARRFGRVAAVAGSVVAAFVWFLIDAVSDNARTVAVSGWNSAVRVGFFLTITLLLVGLKEVLARQSELSRADPLTGLWNRRAFEEFAARDVARARRTGEPLSAVALDVDDFKTINDTAGHAAGDEALVAIARALTSTVRATDLVSRPGGDEFVLLLSGDEAAVCRVLERIQDAVAASPVQGMTLSCSIGAFTSRTGSLADALRQADANLYVSKAQGKGRFTLTSEDVIAG